GEAQLLLDPGGEAILDLLSKALGPGGIVLAVDILSPRRRHADQRDHREAPESAGHHPSSRSSTRSSSVVSKSSSPLLSTPSTDVPIGTSSDCSTASSSGVPRLSSSGKGISATSTPR